MRPLLIAGPTGAGKSAFALKAAREGGVVINADASQVYSGWRVLTARPDEAEEAEAPHRLYGHIDPSRRYSTGDWLRDLTEELKAAEAAGLRPIIIGGTGLYFTAATSGLASIPPPPEDVRERVAAQLSAEGLPALVADLQARDAETAARIDLNNPMRVSRALEVLNATGRGLSDWWKETEPPLIAEAERCLILPEREALYARLDQRFDAMLERGAVEEAEAMLARGLNPALPAMKAVGAPELFAFLEGRISREEAADKAKQATRNYAKRQMTWMRNRMQDWEIIQ